MDTFMCAKCGYKTEAQDYKAKEIELFFADHDCDLTKLQSSIQRVRELHLPNGIIETLGGITVACITCSGAYPCPTIKALDGDE